MAAWDSPMQVIWNIAMVLLCVAALAAIFHPRSRQIRQGWRSKVLWLIPLTMSVGIRGYSLPVGAVFVLWQVRSGWGELDAERQERESIASVRAAALG